VQPEAGQLAAERREQPDLLRVIDGHREIPLTPRHRSVILRIDSIGESAFRLDAMMGAFSTPMYFLCLRFVASSA
jgi:hypothetical protein